MQTSNNGRKVMILMTIIAVIILSIALGEWTKPLCMNTPTMKYLDDKIGTTAVLMATTAATATGLAMIPDDSTTPVATHIMNMSVGLLIVDVILSLEKLVASTSIYLLFTLFIPAFCILGYLAFVCNKKQFVPFMTKLAIFTLCFLLLVPVSAKIGDIVEKSPVMPQFNEEELPQEEESNFWDKLVNGIENVSNYAKDMLAYFMNVIVAMLITNCVIPIIVAWLFVQVSKRVFSLDAAFLDIQSFTKKIFTAGNKMRRNVEPKEDETDEIASGE